MQHQRTNLSGADLIFCRVANNHHESLKVQRATLRTAQLHRISRTCSKIVTAATVLGVLNWLARLGV